MINEERLTILRMLEAGQINAGQAAELLETAESTAEPETTLPDATVEEEAWMLTALLQVTEAISSPSSDQDSLDEMLARVVRIVPLLAGVDRCSVFLWDERAEAFAPRVWYPSDERPQQPTPD